MFKHSDILFAIIAIASLISLFYEMQNFRKQSQKDSETRLKVCAKIRGKKTCYSVLVKYENGFWWSPFTTRAGFPIKRESPQQLASSIKGCIKKDEFALQLKDLIEAGVIIVA